MEWGVLWADWVVHSLGWGGLNEGAQIRYELCSGLQSLQGVGGSPGFGADGEGPWGGPHRATGLSQRSLPQRLVMSLTHFLPAGPQTR